MYFPLAGVLLLCALGAYAAMQALSTRFKMAPQNAQIAAIGTLASSHGRKRHLHPAIPSCRPHHLALAATMLNMSSSDVGLPSSESSRVRPPRAPGLVRNPAPEEVGARIDWSCWYLSEEDDMGCGTTHWNAMLKLAESLEVIVQQRGWTDAFVGGDQFIAWVEHEPNVRISPDVCLIRPAPDPLPESWQLWRPGHLPPCFAVEIVSPSTWRKDYEDNPVKYAQLGALELFIFDPEVLLGQTEDPKRYALQLYQREADGSFVRTYVGSGPVYSEQVELWLLMRVENGLPQLRLAHDPKGEQLVPIASEQHQTVEQLEQQLRQAEREQQLAAQREREAAQREQEQQRARQAAESELQALRAQLAQAAERPSESSGND